MKLFQRLLVAPAALGLMAPLAANAADLTTTDHSVSTAEVQNLSDIHPSDWAFQALTTLAERNGCATATPAASMTRYEAAALLNKCLGNVAQLTEEESVLVKEFSPELAVIKGRVEGLESRISEFEAGQFSSTTTMNGKAAFITGYVDNDTTEDSDQITFEYMYQLNLNSSFTGEDLLYTRIKTGNVGDHFKDKSQGSYLSAANGNGDVLEVDKLWYQFPVGESLQVWVGPKIENYYMLASAPSIYRPVTKQFALGGNGPVYGSSTSPGFGVAWTQQTDNDARWAISAAYTAKDGASSSSDLGLIGEDTRSALLTKVEYGAPRWQVSAAAAFKDNGWEDSYYATSLGADRAGDSSETAVGLRGYWRPDTTGAVPSVQVGYDFSNINDAGTGHADETAGWMVGLGWSDLWVDGNKAGIALGSRVSAQSIVGGGDDPADDNTVWEAYYTFKINDGVSVTPAVFGGEDTSDGDEEISGAVLLTEFRF